MIDRENSRENCLFEHPIKTFSNRWCSWSHRAHQRIIAHDKKQIFWVILLYKRNWILQKLLKSSRDALSYCPLNVLLHSISWCCGQNGDSAMFRSRLTWPTLRTSISQCAIDGRSSIWRHLKGLSECLKLEFFFTCCASLVKSYSTAKVRPKNWESCGMTCGSRFADSI